MVWKKGDIIKIINKGNYGDVFIAKIVDVYSDDTYTLKALLVIIPNKRTNYDVTIESDKEDIIVKPSRKELELVMVEAL